ncbi:protein of unknown function [Streptomyces sp. TLI_053]|uniref:DUF397 domain-containing protein n=1 Tax=Streptomyces sp. TLI_053 TaxID=1855352 RepID=UPI00087ACEB8|nr:DUF397 domain-containing protein [Streptomyces sp. TLI_053]SDT78530.1 protein of unknown function [Streptomyces sp. TLI_053]
MHSIATWYKSSYSGSEGGNCIEVADGSTGTVPVRDSKDPHGPTLTFTTAAWRSFITAINTGELPARP